MKNSSINYILAFILAFYLFVKSPEISPRCKPRVLLLLLFFCVCVCMHSALGICIALQILWCRWKPFKAFVFSSSASSSQSFWSVCCLFLPSLLAPVGQYMSLNYFNRHCLGSSSSLERVSGGCKTKANA